MLSEEIIKEFKEYYKEKTGEEISLEEIPELYESLKSKIDLLYL